MCETGKRPPESAEMSKRPLPKGEKEKNDLTLINKPKPTNQP